MARQDPLANPEEAVRRVYAYAAYRLGDGAEAEDVTSATIERALGTGPRTTRARATRLPGWSASRGAPSTSTTGARRWPRRSRRCPSGPTDDPFEDRSIERLAMAAAVGRLDPRERELIALRYGADLTARQIADLLGQRTNTVEVALHRALGAAARPSSRRRSRTRCKETGVTER